MSIDYSYVLILSAILFSIGLLGVLLRRNTLVMFMSVEVMLNSANLALIAFSKVWGNLHGQVGAFFVMVVAAAEVVVGLALIVTIYRSRGTVSVDQMNKLRN